MEKVAFNLDCKTETNPSEFKQTFMHWNKEQLQD